MNGDPLFTAFHVLVYPSIAIVFVLFIAKGPTRVVKLAVLALVVVFLVGTGLRSGWETGLTVLGVLFGIQIVSMGSAALLHRMPLKKNLRLMEYGTACPGHGVKKLQDWTRGFEALGFDAIGDYETTWSFASSKRRVLIRFLLHRSREMWAEVHILDQPKMAARMVASRKEGGLYLATCDQQANEEFFRDEQTHIRRAPSRSTCADMVQSHQRLVLEIPAAPLRIEDPVFEHVEIYDGWIRRLLDSGQLTVRGDAAAVPLHLVLPVAFRVMGAWFH